MSARVVNPTSGVVLFCGDHAYLETCRAPGPRLTWQAVAPAVLRQTIEACGAMLALVLTMREGPPTTVPAMSRQLLTLSPTASANTLELLQIARGARPGAPVILLTHRGLPLEACCQAVGLGAAALVDGDATGWQERLAETLAGLQQARAEPAHYGLEHDPQELLDAVGIMAVSRPMRELILRAHRAAQVSDATVLIHGESGTGKQLLAEAIHRLDPKRARQSFIAVNCAAITGTLAESELFGHARGAFTGATEARAGYFKAAHRGTILLDEISELPMGLQPKLLRVLQEGRVLPVGSDREEPIDVRVIAASNLSLQEKVAQGTFRLDLYQRLNVIHLTIPPLRQRAEDIPLLVIHFLKKYAHYYGRTIDKVDPRVFELLRRRLGRGNVRELENVIRQTLVFKRFGDRIELGDLPADLLEGPAPQPTQELIPTEVANHLVRLIRDGRLTLRQAIQAFERRVIQETARQHPEWSKVELAKALGLPRRTLYYKLEGNAEEGRG